MNAATRFLEDLSANAHPAPRVQQYDGWTLRFAGGYTGRANSVLPAWPSSLPLPRKVEECERRYAAQGLPALFKLTPEEPDLDRLLERRGYRARTPTHVMTLAGNLLPGPEPAAAVEVAEGAGAAWREAWFALEGMDDPAQRALALAIDAGILNPVLTGLVRAAGQPVACGMAVLESGYASLKGVVVHKGMRGRGLGEALCRGLLAAARRASADRACLQVVQGNAAAKRLYRRLGFEVAYDYWYRQP